MLRAYYPVLSIIFFEVLFLLSLLGIYKWLSPFINGLTYKIVFILLFLVSQACFLTIVYSAFYKSGINFIYITYIIGILLACFYIALIFNIGVIARWSISKFVINQNYLTGIQIFFAILMPTILVFITIRGIHNAYNQTVTHYDVSTHKKLDAPLKIMMISDQHFGKLFGADSLKQTIAIQEKMKPDIILIAGDIIDNDFKYWKKRGLSEYFAQLHAKYGVYAVLGNHDNYAHQQSQIVAALEKAGVITLRDEAQLVANKFWVVGRRDIFETEERKSYPEIEEEYPAMANSDLPVIVIDHQPYQFPLLENSSLDLQVSGHTHAGQTFPLNIIVRLVNSLFYGEYKSINPNQTLIISSGVGLWGIPFRIGSQAEVVEISLTSDKK